MNGEWQFLLSGQKNFTAASLCHSLVPHTIGDLLLHIKLVMKLF